VSFVSKSYGENVDEIFRVDNQWANRSLFEYLCLGKGPHDWTNIEPPLRTAIAFGLLSVKIGHANTSREILWVDHIPQPKVQCLKSPNFGTFDAELPNFASEGEEYFHQVDHTESAKGRGSSGPNLGTPMYAQTTTQSDQIFDETKL